MYLMTPQKYKWKQYSKYEDGEEETEKKVAKCYNIEYEHSTQGQSEKANSFKNCNFRHLLQKL